MTQIVSTLDWVARDTIQGAAMGLKRITKQDISAGAAMMITNMIDNENEIDVAIGLSALEAIIKEVKSSVDYTTAVRSAIESQGEAGKIKLPNGTCIELAEVGTKYDYSNDPEWQRLDKQLKQTAFEIKQREEFLRRIPAGKMFVDETTGETTYGPAKSSTSSYKVTISK